MCDIHGEVIDSQIIAEHVAFLDHCFDNSFMLENTLPTVKAAFNSDEINENAYQQLQLRKKLKHSQIGCSQLHSSSFRNATITSQCIENTKIVNTNLKEWGLPLEISSKYEQRGISKMFEWQVSCLGNSKVLLDCCNLVYSAPTSAGKTLVAEILTIKTVLERQKKVIIILPFVSIVREKMFYLQDILSSSGIRVEGFMGSQSPPGGLQAVHIAICTIEKANSLVNKLLDDGNISELGAVIVDELHLLGDPHRGYILELLLTKIKYFSSKLDLQIQIVGMSATLPNLDVLANWLDAELFITQFRPIPLDEYCLVGNKYYNKSGKCTGNLKYDNQVNGAEGDNVLKICLDTIHEGCSILIFCMTKNRCENLAQNISSSFYKLGCAGGDMGLVLRNQLKSDNIYEVLEQLRNCPVGLDQVLKNTISFGVAFHHAGLTFDERDIIEGGFKSGAIRVLVATSTLSSGVNLPARKVIIRSPVFQRQPVNILTYKQMIGRAGRMGKDTKGESILICSEAEKKIGLDLMTGALKPIKSCIEGEDKYMRAMLEMIASQVACSKQDLELYSKCTLLFSQENKVISQNTLLEATLAQLVNYELIRIQGESDDRQYIATSLGKACLSSSMAPSDGLSLFCELQKARQCLVLETDLHLIYLVTPYSVSNQWNNIDWLHLLTMWESLTKAMKRVGELVGVQESFIIRCLRGTNKLNNMQSKFNIHKRFYTALALQDLVNEVPLSDVANKFQCARGFIQGLQQAASTFAGMVTAFCRQLGWKNMEMLVSQFQDRLHFGIQSELIELMKLPSLNGTRARALFNAGFESLASIASADRLVIENLLYKAIPFQSEKEREGDDSDDMRKRNKIKNIWITGCCGMTTKEAAQNLVAEARKYLENEIGVKEIKWNSIANNTHSHSVVVLENNIENHINNEIINIDLEQPTVLNNHKVISASKENISEAIIVDLPQQDNGCVLNVQINTIKIYENGDHSIPTLQKDLNSTNKLLVNQAKSALNNNSINTAQFPKKTDDFMWDSLDVTKAALDNISKVRTSDVIFSPNISFSDTEGKQKGNKSCESKQCSTNSSKDLSLFSSEGDNSSLFEDSLPLDLIPSKILDANETHKDKDIMIDSHIHSSTFLNAFKSTLYEMDDGEDIKLVYEEDKLSENEENEVLDTQTDIDIVSKRPFITPLKRRSTKEQKHQPQTKKCKIGIKSRLRCCAKLDTDKTKEFIPKLRNPQSRKICVKIGALEMKCYLLLGIDILENIQRIIDEIKSISIYLSLANMSMSAKEIIGRKIVKPAFKYEHENELLINCISFNISDNVCICLDLTSLEDKSLTETKDKLRIWLQTKSLKLKVLSLKSFYVYAKQFLKEDVCASAFDLTIADWLIDSDEKITDIVYLVKNYCYIDLKTTPAYINGVKKSVKNLSVDEDTCVKAWFVWLISEKQEIILAEQYHNIRDILDIETHVSAILGKCEYYGIRVDKTLAAQLLIDVRNSQEILQKKAFRICGYKFNFNSTKDVAKVLGIYRGRKVSTKKSVLTSHCSPMASLVIYWRRLNSILTKTLYPLTEQACVYSHGDRIRPSYTMYTCTGRISMHEPNLQNVPRTFSIPVSYLTEEDQPDDVIEFNCRNIFKAAPGHVLVSADYCQLEMRILTHYSQDAVLVSIMRSGVDVFKAIAASWGSIPEEEVDDDLRQKAKQLCYGILYGMGNRTLAQNLDVGEMEAAVFMDTFYKTYPGIKVFTNSVIEKCRKNGYVETLMKRRRYLPDIKSTVMSKKGAAERQAVNTTIQGSAADIAKAAMCAIDDKISTFTNKPHLILQMHDELVYEVHGNDKNNFIKLLKEAMETTVRLDVPLPVKVKSGLSWGSLEEIRF